jgi:hypothetical protein
MNRYQMRESALERLRLGDVTARLPTQFVGRESKSCCGRLRKRAPMIVSDIHGHTARRRSFELIASPASIGR